MVGFVCRKTGVVGKSRLFLVNSEELVCGFQLRLAGIPYNRLLRRA